MTHVHSLITLVEHTHTPCHARCPSVGHICILVRIYARRLNSDSGRRPMEWSGVAGRPLVALVAVHPHPTYAGSAGSAIVQNVTLILHKHDLFKFTRARRANVAPPSPPHRRQSSPRPRSQARPASQLPFTTGSLSLSHGYVNLTRQPTLASITVYFACNANICRLPSAKASAVCLYVLTSHSRGMHVCTVIYGYGWRYAGIHVFHFVASTVRLRATRLPAPTPDHPHPPSGVIFSPPVVVRLFPPHPLPRLRSRVASSTLPLAETTHAPNFKRRAQTQRGGRVVCGGWPGSNPYQCRRRHR